MKRNRQGHTGVTIIELLVVVCIFLLMVALLTPFVNMAKRRWQRMECANNLREISLALHSYAADHNDAFPARLGELYPNYVSRETAFDCPAIKNIGTVEAPDYEYAAGLTEMSPPKETIVRDKDGNHRKTGKNILRTDGSVEWVGRGH